MANGFGYIIQISDRKVTHFIIFLKVLEDTIEYGIINKYGIININTLQFMCRQSRENNPETLFYFISNQKIREATIWNAMGYLLK